MSQVIQQEALTRLLVEKGIFSKEEFLEMVKILDQEMKRKRKRPNGKEVCEIMKCHRQPAGEHEQQHAVGDAVKKDGEHEKGAPPGGGAVLCGE